jgi:hypothetical protein
VLGFIPGWVTARILNAFGALRIPRQIEIAGLDIGQEITQDQDAKDLAESQRQAAGAAGLA